MSSLTSSAQAIIDGLNRLREELSRESYLSINSLSSLNGNVSLLFDYITEAFLILAREKQALQQSLAHLQAKIYRHGLQFVFQEENHQEHKNTENEALDNLNKRMSQMIQQKAELEGIKREGDARKSHTSEFAPHSSLNKRQNSKQFNRATAFIREHLIDKLEEDPSRSVEIPKNAILNLYLKWSQSQGRQVDYRNLSSVQMALTNQIRRCFPNCTHNSRNFKGIQFQQQHVPQLKTDIKTMQTMDDEDSPPLPSFPDDHLAE